MTIDEMKTIDRFLMREPQPVWKDQIVEGLLSLEELQAIVRMQCETYKMLKALKKGKR